MRKTIFIIHQIFLLTRDWPKHIMWPNIPQLKLGNIQLGNIGGYSPILKIAQVVKQIWRIIKTIASIWDESILGYLPLDIICSEKQTVFRERNLFLVAHSFPWATLSENCSLLGTDNVRGQISVHIFAPNGGYCLYITHLVGIAGYTCNSFHCKIKSRRVKAVKRNLRAKWRTDHDRWSSKSYSVYRCINMDKIQWGYGCL